MEVSGTRGVPWRQTEHVVESSLGTEREVYMSISAMPEYGNKSVEELRWEDQQVSLVSNM